MSFEYYLSNFPIHPIGAVVQYFDGRVKANDNIYISVFNIDIGKICNSVPTLLSGFRRSGCTAGSDLLN